MTTAAAAEPIPATVMVLTRNAEATLPAALASVADFAEVIVADGHSTDGTAAVARSLGATVIEQDEAFLDPSGRLCDYAGARHQVVRAAGQPWIFHLDADEVATPELTAAIRDATQHDDGSVAGYLCGARHLVAGTTVRSAANYPMRFLRVFRRDAVTGYAGPINERPEFAAGAPIGSLDADFLIPMPPLATVLRKWIHYQRIIVRGGRATELRVWWRNELPARWREVRWLAWRTWKAHRAEPGPRMPLRYDLARVGFHAAALVASGVGAAAGTIRRGMAR